jgi:hypothetical protein
MTPRCAPVTPRFRVGITLLVSALLIVPAVVRAAGTLEGSRPSPVRLSRGFELPPTKCNVAPPVNTAMVVVVLSEPATVPLGRHASNVDEPVSAAPSDCAPDPLRGPPVTPLF